jgi:hypothetical protein
MAGNPFTSPVTFLRNFTEISIADTCYDPTLIKKMHDDGVLGKGRSDFFLNFKWHHNLILHEVSENFQVEKVTVFGGSSSHTHSSFYTGRPPRRCQTTSLLSSHIQEIRPRRNR